MDTPTQTGLFMDTPTQTCLSMDTPTQTGLSMDTPTQTCLFMGLIVKLIFCVMCSLPDEMVEVQMLQWRRSDVEVQIRSNGGGADVLVKN